MLLSALHYAAAMSGPTDVLEALLEFGADIDAVNDDGATPLFFACQCNNQFAASVLIGNGSNVRIKNLQGARDVNIPTFEYFTYFLCCEFQG